MKLFELNKNTTYTVVIGCGRLGANLANTLSDEGENVLILDKDESVFRKLSPSFGGLAIVGDGMNLDDLYAVKLEKADVVVVVTNNDNINIIIAQIAREFFHVERVIVRLYDPQRECVYREFGIDTICPAELSAKEIKKILSKKEDDGKQIKIKQEEEQ